MPGAHKQYACLAVVFLAAVLCQVRFFAESVRDLFYGDEQARSPVWTESTSPIIVSVTTEASDAGVRKGDELVSVNGRRYTGLSVLHEPVARAKPGDRISLVVRSPEQALREAERSAQIELRARSETRPLPARWLPDSVISLVMPLFCLLLGFFVSAVRPRDPRAWLVLGLMLSFGQFHPLNLWGLERWIRGLAISYRTVLQSAWPLWMMLLGLYFPERLDLDRRWPWAKWLLVAPLLGGSLCEVIVDVGRQENFASVQSLDRAYSPFRLPVFILGMVAVGTFFASLGYRSGTTASRDARRRLRLLFYGSQVSLTPMFFLVVAALWRGNAPLEGWPPWILIAALSCLFLFPITLAYVIVVHRALDVRVVIRQGVRYALARGGVRALQVVITATILFASITLAVDPTVNRPRRITIIAAGIGIVLAIRRAAERLRNWIDRRFFREAYDAEQILNELGEEVRTMVEVGPLLETVARRISESLHVARVVFFVVRNGVYRPAYALGYMGDSNLSFPADGATLNHLKVAREPVKVFVDDPNSWIYREPGMQDEERAQLRLLETQLLLPLATREKVPGIISLGPKQSEEPYSGNDLRLLQSVTTQTGLALENARLTAAIAAEVAQRERLNRELEIAREVQERLFPQDLPSVPGLDFAGYCRPALGVGGDYYDFLPLESGCLGIAIGDVSGKGIAAALLMASLQASLRGQTIQGTGSLAALMRNVNRLIYEASPQSRYATFFYAQYDPSSRRMVYVNAGHNPPLLFRTENGYVRLIRLDVGGVVVGMLRDFHYQQGDLALEPGDLLVAYTDGISEAMNPAEEEWGEDRLVEVARSCRGQRAAEAIENLMEAADAFAAGAPQHDDMTLVVMRVLG